MKKKVKKNLSNFDYHMLFVLGVCFSGVGLAFLLAIDSGLGISFVGVGIVYMIIGVINNGNQSKKRRR